MKEKQKWELGTARLIATESTINASLLFASLKRIEEKLAVLCAEVRGLRTRKKRRSSDPCGSPGERL